MPVAILFGAAAAGLFIAGFQWGLYLLAGIPLAIAVGVGLMIPAISHDGAARWLPRPLRDFTLAAGVQREWKRMCKRCRRGNWLHWNS